MNRHVYAVLFFLLTIFVHPTFAQEQAVDQIVISDVDTAFFPDVLLTYRVLDEAGQIVPNAPITLTENGETIEQFDTASLVDTGVEYTLVIDANQTMFNIDEQGGISRVAKTRTAIADFSRQFVNRAGLDRVTVITPQGNEPFLLVNRADEQQIVVDAIGDFNPTELPERAPMQEMLTLALQRSAETSGDGRYQVVMLFTNGSFLDEQLDYDVLLTIAEQSETEFYGIILGERADPNEIANITPFTNAMGGGYVHMPQPNSLSRLGEVTAANGQQAQLTYQSAALESGEQVVRLASGEVAAETTYAVNLQPPTVEILLSNRPIIRKGDGSVPTTEIEPTNVEVQALVSFASGQERPLESVTFTVNDEVQPLPRGALLDNNGVLTVDWNISVLPAGSYRLQITVVDEYGQVGESNELLLPLALQINRPTVTPVPDATSTPIPSAIEQATEVVQPYLTRENLVLGLMGLIPLLLLFLLWRFIKSRRARPVQPVMPEPIPDESRPLIPPSDEEAAESDLLPSPACLEVFTPGTGDVTERLPLTKLTHIIGSDPFSADTIIDHGSVSRLHASIRYEHNRFTLYDEGSAYGTRLNFEQLGLSPRFLKDGDELSFGEIYTRFKISACEEEA